MTTFYKTNSGSVFVFTLWLITALAGAALVFGHTAMLNYRRVGNRIAAIQAEHANEAALQYVLQFLAATAPGDLPEPDSFKAEELAVGTCRVWFLAQASDINASVPTFGLRDEAGKLNLNYAELETLLSLPGMTAELAGAIVDWRDPDDELSASGAESETYLSRQPAYLAKNAPFETVGELGLLNGAEPVLLNGRDLNRNGILEPWERSLAVESRIRFAELPDIGFLELFTVYSQEPNTTAAGEARVNLNAGGNSPLPALIDVLGSARAVQVAQAAGFGSRQFRSVLEFCIRGGLNAEETEKIFARFTTADAGMSGGLVNVNTAPRAVLTALPGIGAGLADQVIAYRTANPARLDTAFWLVHAVGQEAALAAAPYVTTKSYQITADIVAVAANATAFHRVRYVIDTTSGTPVVVARRDLTQYGWPLGFEWRHELQQRRREEL